MGGNIHSYQDLKIWQKAMNIVYLVYEAFDNFPDEERHGLQSQMKRASISIPSNIAEGWGRNSRATFLYFLKVSRGSLLELETQLLLAKHLGFLKDMGFKKIMDEVTQESKMLNAYINSLRKKQLNN